MLSRRRFLQTSSLLILVAGTACNLLQHGPGSRRGPRRSGAGRHSIGWRQRWSEHRRPLCRRRLRSGTRQIAIGNQQAAQARRSHGLASQHARGPRSCSTIPVCRSCKGVSYPNPDRSHFRGMAIWQTAKFDDAAASGLWLARQRARPTAAEIGPRRAGRRHLRRLAGNAGGACGAVGRRQRPSPEPKT